MAVDASVGVDPDVVAEIPGDGAVVEDGVTSSCPVDSAAGSAALTASRTALKPLPVGAGEEDARGALRTMAAESGASVTFRSSSRSGPRPIGNPRNR